MNVTLLKSNNLIESDRTLRQRRDFFTAWCYVGILGPRERRPMFRHHLPA